MPVKTRSQTLEERRRYYAANRDHIRARDNAAQKKLKEQYPERYKEYGVIGAKQAKEKKQNILAHGPYNKCLTNNPERKKIEQYIAAEKMRKGGDCHI